MEDPYIRGVNYLSFRDESLARSIAEADWTRECLPDISISADDVENRQLMRRVREEIAEWRRETNVRPSAYS